MRNPTARCKAASCLHCGALPLPAQCVTDFYVNFRPIKCASANILLEGPSLTLLHVAGEGCISAHAFLTLHS